MEETLGTPKSSSRKILFDSANCKYDIVRNCAANLGWKHNDKNDEDWTVFWIDTSVSVERVMKMRSFQKINHFPGMTEIARKVPLAKHLNRMQQAYPNEFNFYPPTWFKKDKESDGKAFIIKPSAGSQGKGIILTKDKDEVNKYANCVVQLYMDKPYLIDGYKFDLRVYALILSVDPLRIYMYNDGLVRLCTEHYKAPTVRNMKISCMHLTNYSLNKNSSKFEASDNFSTGMKRNFSFLNDYFVKQGCDPKCIWDRVADVIIKTVVSILPQLQKTYRMCLPSDLHGSFGCFEVLGFDIFFDEGLNPWLLEVNHSPSFNTDTPLDQVVKTGLISETMQLLAVNPKDRSKAKKLEKAVTKERVTGVSNATMSKFSQEEELAYHEEEEAKFRKNYNLIYPIADSSKYDAMIAEADASLQRLNERRTPLFPAPVFAVKGLKPSTADKENEAIKNSKKKEVPGEEEKEEKKPFIKPSLYNHQYVYAQKKHEAMKSLKSVPIMTLGLQSFPMELNFPVPKKNSRHSAHRARAQPFIVQEEMPLNGFSLNAQSWY